MYPTSCIFAASDLSIKHSLFILFLFLTLASACYLLYLLMSAVGLIRPTNPFADPLIDSFAPTESDDTLPVGRNASLTLGTDSLVVLGEELSHRNPVRWLTRLKDESIASNGRTHCCGLYPLKPTSTRLVPFYNILSADIHDLEIVIRYAQPTSKTVIRVASLQYVFEKSDHSHAVRWVARLIDKAYGQSQTRKRIKVLINPFGGQGKAFKWYARDIEPIFAAAKCQLDVEKTQRRGHAVEIAETLDIDNFDVVAACSGDGLPHEIFNGLGRRSDARRALNKLAVVQLPCGSGNAMSWNLNGTDSPSLAALAVVKGVRMPMDLVSITQGETKTLSFLSQSVGIVAEADLGTDNIRWMGDARFIYGFLSRLLRKTIYPCEVSVKVEIESKAEIKDHFRKYTRSSDNPSSRDADDPAVLELGDGLAMPTLKYGTVNDPIPSDWTTIDGSKMGNFYCGNMTYMAADTPFFPWTLPADGCMDLVTINGDIKRTSAVGLLLAVEKGTLVDNNLVGYRKISGYRITPRDQLDGYISIDGERMPFAPFQAEVHKGLGTVLSKDSKAFYGSGFKDHT